MLKHPLFRDPKVFVGLAKYEAGVDGAKVVSALRRVKHYATTHGAEEPTQGVCYNMYRELRRQGMDEARAAYLEEWLVYYFTGREMPIAGYQEAGNLWWGEQLAARLELIDALIQDIEA